MDMKNLKNTKNRTLILNILKDSSSPLCAEDIYNNINKKINIATIYRNLNTLTDKRILVKTIFEDGKMYYKISNDSHIHSLVCTICHSITPIENCPIDLIANTIKSNTGFIITSHSLEIRGICPKCQKLK